MRSERQPRKVAFRLCAALKLTEKNKLLEVEGRHVSHCPIAGDVDANVVGATSSEGCLDGRCSGRLVVRV